MSLTMGAAAAELSKKSFPTLGAAADCAASAMLRGARGNSGEMCIRDSLQPELDRRRTRCEAAILGRQQLRI